MGGVRPTGSLEIVGPAVDGCPGTLWIGAPALFVTGTMPGGCDHRIASLHGDPWHTFSRGMLRAARRRSLIYRALCTGWQCEMTDECRVSVGGSHAAVAGLRALTA